MINLVYMVLFIYYVLKVIKSFIQGEFVCLEEHSVHKTLVLIRF